MRKLWPLKIIGLKTQKKNKPPNNTKAGLQTPKKFLVCYSTTIRVQA
jgi:hypothetical protein